MRYLTSTLVYLYYYYNGQSKRLKLLSSLIYLLRKLRKRRLKSYCNSYFIRLLQKIYQRVLRRKKLSLVAISLIVRVPSLRSYGYILYYLAEIQLYTLAISSSTSLPPFSAPSLPLFRPLDLAILNIQQVQRPQAKDEQYSIGGR